MLIFFIINIYIILYLIGWNKNEFLYKHCPGPKGTGVNVVPDTMPSLKDTPADYDTFFQVIGHVSEINIYFNFNLP